MMMPRSNFVGTSTPHGALRASGFSTWANPSVMWYDTANLSDPAPVKLILEVRSGPETGKKIEVTPGQLLRIGRTPRSDVVFQNDVHMSGVHFAVQSDEHSCWIRDYKSTNGTLLNGQRIMEAALTGGEMITAGTTEFFVRLEKEASRQASTAPPPAPVSQPQARLLALLRSEFRPQYAIVDAAREPSVLKVLVESREECQSLFEGPQGYQLAHFAPYLVKLSPDSPFMETLVKAGWGKSWCVFVVCERPLVEVRKHLQNFLRVTIEGQGEVYFRYYDPRVLRKFLPTCLPEQVAQFFGPIRYFLAEDETGSALLRFSNAGRGAGLKTFPLSSVLPEAESDTLTEPF
jgi:hypothetical protein